MTQMESLRAIANALLYEGYMLYPYRRSALKNQRPGWSFGSLLPPAYVAANPGESAFMSAEVLASAEEDGAFEIEVRFLQLQDGAAEGATERSVEAHIAVGELLRQSQTIPFLFEGKPSPIEGSLELSAELIAEKIARVSLSLCNRSHSPSQFSNRDEALHQALIAAHAVMVISKGAFISLLNPPASLRDAASSCRHTGVFPVLVGHSSERNAMLLSPIILYDYPLIAPESRGDFFDSSEIDELLTLRVLTLSDAEKQEIRRTNPRAREVLRRTESTTPKEVLKMHGVFRDSHEDERRAMADWEVFGVSAASQTVWVFGVELKPGSRVRLWPQRRADIFDMALAGKCAIIESIERTVEDEIYVAVTVEGDPGADLGLERQVGHRFFFRADEIEPVAEMENS